MVLSVGRFAFLQPPHPNSSILTHTTTSTAAYSASPTVMGLLVGEARVVS